MKIKNSKFKIKNGLLRLNPKRCTLNPKKGFGLIEILIASAILSASLITLTASSQIAFRLMKDSLERTQAGFLAEEGVEVVRILRDTSWSNNIEFLLTDTMYYLAFSTTTSEWNISVTEPPLIENIFNRTVVFDDVYRRNSDGEIVDEDSLDPKTLDPDTKKVTIQILWEPVHVVSIGTYITNIFQN